MTLLGRLQFLAWVVALVAAYATAPPIAAQQRGSGPDPLAAIVAEALENNLGLAQENLAVERADAGVRETRGRFFPTLSLDARYSEQSGTLNLGDFVNPAYDALNRVTGTNQFPTDLNVTLPIRTSPGSGWCSRCSTHRSSPVTRSRATLATDSASSAVPPRGGSPPRHSRRFSRSVPRGAPGAPGRRRSRW